MGTYNNAYEILSEVREDINDYSTEFVEGTDTSGAFTNSNLLRKINKALAFIYAILLERIPEEFLESEELTAVDSVLTLPADYGRLKILKNSAGRKCFPIGIDQTKLEESAGNDRLYRRQGRTLVIDRDSVTDTYTLWYHRLCREIHSGAFGTCVTGVTGVLDSTYAKKIADYYNSMAIENVTDDWIGTITDYTAARVASIVAVGDDKDSYYGLVPEIPMAFRHLIAPLAVIFTRTHPLSMVNPNAAEYKGWIDMLREALKGYAGPPEDIDVEEIFQDLEPSTPVNIGIL